jgi:D-alanyl-D-alanine carboxypeptidase (penicillin-binding protein 5/6)
MSLRTLSLVIAILAVSPLRAVAEESLKSRLQPLIDEYDGTIGVSIMHLPSGESFEFNGNLPLPTASLIKFSIMVALYDAIERGEVDLGTPIRLREEDKVPGSGILTSNFSAGTQLSLRDALRLMIVHSDNTATNLVVDKIGLPATARLMEQMKCPNTKLHAKVFRRDTSIFPKRSKEFGLGSTTANEMVRLLGRLDAGELVSKPASQQMLELLFACNDRTKIPRDLPSEVKVAHKTGAVSNSRTDAGIIDAASGRIAICILTHDNKDRGWTDDNAAHVVCGKIARAAYDHFNPEGEPAAGPKVLRVGSDGELVEALQRTINVRLQPSPDLGIDGDFGPATQGAVVAFQKQSGLPTSGDVDADTWQALGTLITEDAPVADPSIVNSELFSRASPRALGSPPRVTCKAWAVGDGHSGKLLWGDNQQERLHPASTTKIMTGFLVTTLARVDPSILNETVTFSQRADETVGSSCRLKVGEQVPVNELLYGLLLPSGNDASVALAEHFGSRAFPKGGNGSPLDQGEEPFEQFVGAMNAMASRLGMNETHYDNTHGLTEETHLTSARDLLALAHASMEDEEFRKRTNTRQRGCTVEGQSGYKRNVIWNNTNRLLAIEGYDGVKTGTTSAAGSCLVSRANRTDKQLIVVVLGSATSEARYVDSQNLYEWAWRQLDAGNK